MHKLHLRARSAPSLKQTLIACVCAASVFNSSADIYTLTTYFDTPEDGTVTGPFVGTGTLSYNAPSALESGSYDWYSFAGLTLSLEFPEVTFREWNLISPYTEDINIEVRGSAFFFSTHAGPPYNGPGQAGDPVKFRAVLGAYTYTFVSHPVYADYPGIPTYSLDRNTTVILYHGDYGAPVPEPSALALLGLAGAGLLYQRRRDR